VIGFQVLLLGIRRIRSRLDDNLEVAWIDIDLAVTHICRIHISKILGRYVLFPELYYGQRYYVSQINENNGIGSIRPLIGIKLTLRRRILPELP
jgi:hypothetical protein